MKRGSLLLRIFRRAQLSVSSYRSMKNSLVGPKIHLEEKKIREKHVILTKT